LFVFLETFPLTPNGKVDRNALPPPNGERPQLDQGFVEPRTEIEELIAQVWREILKLDKIGIHDNFFDLGGHSLLAVRLIARLRARLGRGLALSAVFQHPTVTDMARQLASTGDATAQDLVIELQREGAGAPLYFLPPIGGSVSCYVELARALGRDRPFRALQVPPAAGLEAASIEQLAAMVIEQIRRDRPHGPYLVGGWSMGGVFAFEVARQLRASHEPVPLVVLIDTYPPPRLRGERTDNDDLPMFARFAADLSQLLGRDRDAAVEFLALDAAAQRAALAAALAGDQLRPADVDRELDERLAVFTRNARALEAYDLEPCETPILTIATPDNQTSWASVARGPIARHVAHGDHYSILTRPHVSTIAAWIAAAVRAVDPAPEPTPEYQ
jgi:thioesterase domain-containing protein/acyl carrier protein